MRTTMLWLTLAVALCNSALAQLPPLLDPNRPRPGEQPVKLSFLTLDKNKDGKLTPDEARSNTHVAANFAAADKNGDNSLSAAEFNAHFNKDKD